MGSKKPKPELKVAFDTNVLYTKVASDLVAPKIKEFIEAHSHHPDLAITWLLPSPVIEERRFQMQKVACELLPPVEKVERLLGHGLAITKEILMQKIDQTIAAQLSALGASALDVNTADVNWAVLIQRALSRQPPFDDGENEKGFRDAIIAECFFQLVEKSPKTAPACRLAFVSEDRLLRGHIQETTQARKNVRVLSGIGELESLVNTLVSEVTEDFVAEVTMKAEKLFFERDNQLCLYHKDKVYDRIRNSYANELKAVPTHGLKRESARWLIAKPVFVKKEGSRLTWNSVVTVEDKLSRMLPGKLGLSSLSETTFQGQTEPGTTLKSLADLMYSLTDKFEAARSAFEVHWVARVNAGKKLTAPSVIDIRFVDTKFVEKKWGLPPPPNNL